MLMGPFRIFLFLSLLITTLFPVYTIYFQYPAFTGLLKDNVKGEAVRLASHLSAALVVGSDELTGDNIPDALIRDVRNLEKDSHFIKIKIYSPSGEVLYSSDRREIGNRNQEDYFHSLMEKGLPVVVEVMKDDLSLERQIMPADVVETYVPIERDGKTIGIFEIYYDITGENEKLRSIVRRSSIVLFSMMAVLLLMVVLSTVKAGWSIRARNRAEQERERVILELRDALDNIKTLKGLLPVCAWCKSVRDDSGYWNRVEEYLQKHSDLTFTHGICPECAKKVGEEIRDSHRKQGDDPA